MLGGVYQVSRKFIIHHSSLYRQERQGGGYAQDEELDKKKARNQEANYLRGRSHPYRLQTKYKVEDRCRQCHKPTTSPRIQS